MRCLSIGSGLPLTSKHTLLGLIPWNRTEPAGALSQITFRGPGVFLLQLLQEGHRGRSVAVALQFQPRHPRFREGRLSPVSRHTAE